MTHRIWALVIVVGSAGALVPTGAVHASPQVCYRYSGSSQKSVLGNVEAGVVTFFCTTGSSHGYVSGEAYFCVNLSDQRQTNVDRCPPMLPAYAVCNHDVQMSGPDFIVGQEAWSGGCVPCTGNYDFPLSTGQAYSFPSESGATTARVAIWSYGSTNIDCHEGNSSSPCLAVAGASAP